MKQRHYAWDVNKTNDVKVLGPKIQVNTNIYQMFISYWYPLKKLRKMLDIIGFSLLAIFCYFLIGCWGLLCQKLFYENWGYEDKQGTNLVLAMISVILHQIITGCIILLASLPIICIKNNRRVHVEGRERNHEIETCDLILYILSLVILSTIYFTATAMEYWFQKNHIDGSAPDFFTKASLSYTLCGILKPAPVLALTMGQMFEDGNCCKKEDDLDQMEKGKSKHSSKREKVVELHDGYNSV